MERDSHQAAEGEKMKIGKTKLRMSSGEVRKFKNQGARDRFEKVAQAVKHGFVPNKKNKKKK